MTHDTTRPEPLGPPAPLTHLAGDATWPMERRDDGRVTAVLRARGRRFDAVVTPRVRDLRVRVEIDRRLAPPAEICRAAAGRVLAETAARVPGVRGLTHGDDVAHTLFLETAAGNGVELDHALEALSAACAIVAPETIELLENESLARRCMEHWPPGPSNHAPQT